MASTVYATVRDHHFLYKGNRRGKCQAGTLLQAKEHDTGNAGNKRKEKKDLWKHVRKVKALLEKQVRNPGWC